MSQLRQADATRVAIEPSPRAKRRTRDVSVGVARWQPIATSLPEKVQRAPQPAPRGSSRPGNVLVAAVALAVAAPLMVLIALAVKLSSRGPAVYTQRRIGLDRRDSGRSTIGDRRRRDLGGRPFTIYKFRTMSREAGPPSHQVWTRQNDRRITPLGRVLRTYRLDELPQLVNVIKGDMNLVGPRPEQPDILARLGERLERFPERQRIRPGITGLAQVTCGYGGTVAEVERKLERDLEYIARRSFWLDVVVLARTVPVVLWRRGAR